MTHTREKVVWVLTRDDIVERETNPAILSGQLRVMAQTLDGERRACVIDAADALDVQRAELARLRRTPVAHAFEGGFVVPVSDRIERHIRILMNAAYQTGVERPGDVRRALEVVDNWLATQDPNAGGEG